MSEVTTTGNDFIYFTDAERPVANVITISSVKFTGHAGRTTCAECTCGWEFRMTGGSIHEVHAAISLHSINHAAIKEA